MSQPHNIIQLMPLNPIAYFSLEFGIDDSLPIFAGGLGILAGDMLLEANQQQKSFIGLGLFYQTEENNLQVVTNQSGKPLLIPVPLGKKVIQVKVWKKLVGQTPLYLLDTQVRGNSIDDYNICNRLYVGDKEHRFLQEIVAGIGGTKLLAALKISPQYYHLNEPHCALAIIQALIQTRASNPQLSFRQVFRQTKNKILFTNHTMIMNDHYAVSKELAAIYLAPYAQALKITTGKLLQLGRGKNPRVFSLNQLALSGSIRINAVSRLHSRVAKKIWPGFDFIPITNGVFLNRWLGQPLAEVWPPTQIKPCSKEKFRQAHQQQKRNMLQMVKQQTGIKMEEKILTVAWARRLTNYKRPGAILKDIGRLGLILNNSDRPIQLLMAGKVHPNDRQGKQLVRVLTELSRKPKFRQRFQFLPDYNISVAQKLVGGADVWLNTPKRGREACGTSGMKACLNGVLQMTIRDGWTDSVEWSKLGWTLDSDRVAEDIYRFLEGSVAKMYYQTDPGGLSPEWLSRMVYSSALIRKNYSAARMLNQYEKELYL